MASRPLSLAVYAVATALAEPFAPGVLKRRAAAGKEDAARLGERLGRSATPRPPGPLVWLHGASVGESLSLLPLIAALTLRRPDVSVLVTSGTLTSARLLQRRLPAGVIHQFAPIDSPGAVSRFLGHWRPDLGVRAESELWPNLLLAARRRGVRLALVSARMTAASARSWARAPAAARALLGAFDLILPQDAATEARLAGLGGRIDGRLNLKRIGAPPDADPGELAALRQAIGARPAIVAASTHPGEEALIAEAVSRLAGRAPAPLLIIVPRHPVRGPSIAAELAAEGWQVARRAAGEPIGEETQIYLADTLGEMGLFLSLAAVCVVGGSFIGDFGGHNPLEPARIGVPVVTGPDMANWAEIEAELTAAGGALETRDGAALAETLETLLGDAARREAIGDAALGYAQGQSAALETAVERLLPLLPPAR